MTSFQTDAAGRVVLSDLVVTPQPTPNPNSARFALNKELIPKGTGRDFPSADTAAGSPLAERLFANPDVTSVFVGPEFVTLGVKPGEDPLALLDFATDVLRAHLASGEKAVSETVNAGSVDLSGVAAQISEVIDAMIRPAVAYDGGDVVFMGYEREKGVVKLKLRGACSGCPSSSFTLKMGIQNLLTEKFPNDVRVVEAVS